MLHVVLKSQVRFKPLCRDDGVKAYTVHSPLSAQIAKLPPGCFWYKISHVGQDHDLHHLAPNKPAGSAFILFFCFFYNHHFYFPAHLVGGFTVSDHLDKPWSQVSSLLPPGTCLHVYRA